VEEEEVGPHIARWCPISVFPLVRTIRWKLIISSLLAIGIPLMLFAWVMATLLWDFYRENLKADLQAKAHIVADACAPALDPTTPADPDALARLVEQWMSHSDVRVTIVNAQGVIEAASTPEDRGLTVEEAMRPGLLLALNAGEQNSTIWKNPRYGNQDTMYVNVPVYHDNRKVGAVRVAYTLTQIQQRISRIRTTLFASVTVYAVLIVALTIWLAAGIARPVEALNRDAQKLASGDLDHRVHVEGTEEINLLARTLNQMTQRLQQHEGMRRQYVSNVSHELRTPLASIRGMAETMMEHGETDPALRLRYLPRIVAQTDRLARLATQLLDLAQIESGGMIAFFGPVSVASVIEDVVGTCSGDATAGSVQLHVAVDDDLPEIVADRDRLVQVFLNLVGNALRYTPPGGQVRINATRCDEGILATVADTGKGIPEEHLPHIFGRFYRVDRARTLKSGGTGLGLSIVEQIVKAHGGSVAAESEVGKGTKFTVQLPLQPPDAF
jgi:signal transduction histidine kinase